MLIAGSMFNLKKIFGTLGQVFSGPRWKPSDYRDPYALPAVPVDQDDEIQGPDRVGSCHIEKARRKLNLQALP